MLDYSMKESVKIVDLVVEYTNEEGEIKKVVVVLTEQISSNLGEILEIENYLEKIKSLLTAP